ncbi:MAG: hypothetical protein PHQ52_02220 [Candidatus Omnitrophica bacterium]|nr:hypothetical protein [Candidatus Omnitrophota bacterium]
MVKENRSKINLLLVIPIVVILAVIVLVVFIAYRAETAGVKVGAQNIYLSSVEKQQTTKRTTKNKISRNEADLKEKPGYIANNTSKNQDEKEGYTQAASKKTKDIDHSNGTFGSNRHAETQNNTASIASSTPSSLSAKKNINDTYRQTSPATEKKDPVLDTSGKDNDRKLLSDDIKTETKDQRIFYSFDSSKRSLAPSTLGILQTKELIVNKNSNNTSIVTKEKNIHLKLSGYLSKELFIFNLYNNITDGNLDLRGDFKVTSHGKKTDERTDVLFYYTENDFNNSIQLPTLINGYITPKTFRKNTLYIDKYGKLHCQSPIYIPFPITYSITRMSENSDLSIQQPVSDWLKKEFNSLPVTIKNFLDIAKTGNDEYKMLFVYTLFYKFFGYQKDILPVELPKGKTWDEYLNTYINDNIRLLADCDVLSTYAFIFMKYLDLPTIVCAGYNNTEHKTMTTLDHTEYHAATLVKIKDKWTLFDPSTVTPDFTEEALILSAQKEENQEKINEILSLITQDQKDNVENFKQDFSLSKFPAKKFSMPKTILSLLSEFTTSDTPAVMQSMDTSQSTLLEISDFFKNNEYISSFYQNIDLVAFTCSGLIRICIILVLISFSLKILVKKVASIKKGAFYTQIVTKKLVLASALCTLLIYCLLLAHALGKGLSMFPKYDIVLVIAGILILLSTLILVLRQWKIILHSIKGDLDPCYLWKEKGIIKISRNPDAIGYIFLGVSALLYCPHIITLAIFLGLITINHLIILQKETFYKSNFKDEWEEYSKISERYL